MGIEGKDFGYRVMGVMREVQEEVLKKVEEVEKQFETRIGALEEGKSEKAVGKGSRKTEVRNCSGLKNMGLRYRCQEINKFMPSRPKGNILKETI